MKATIMILALCAFLFAREGETPMVIKTSIDAYIPLDATDMSTDLETIIGGDSNKVSILSSISTPSEDLSKIQADLSLNYIIVIPSFWDIKVGVATNVYPSVNETYFGAGFVGIAPYYIDADVMFLVNKDLNIRLESDFEYELMITQKLIIGLELENTITLVENTMDYSSDITAKIGVEIKKNFIPYISYVLEKENRESSFESKALFGVNFWM